jgi:hypothetical protein
LSSHGITGAEQRDGQAVGRLQQLGNEVGAIEVLAPALVEQRISSASPMPSRTTTSADISDW